MEVEQPGTHMGCRPCRWRLSVLSHGQHPSPLPGNYSWSSVQLLHSEASPLRDWMREEYWLTCALAFYYYVSNNQKSSNLTQRPFIYLHFCWTNIWPGLAAFCVQGLSELPSEVRQKCILSWSMVSFPAPKAVGRFWVAEAMKLKLTSPGCLGPCQWDPFQFSPTCPLTAWQLTSLKPHSFKERPSL